MRLKLWSQVALLLIVSAGLAVVDLPIDQKSFLDCTSKTNQTEIPAEEPNWLVQLGQSAKAKACGMISPLAKSQINLGLDLQGGTHLDYKIDLKGVPEAEQDALVAGVLEVIERRVNALGVAEPNIYESRSGDERHIAVELAGIKDVEEAKAIVGKTIQLEFKEQRTAADPAEAQKITKQAGDFLAAALAVPEDFEKSFEVFEEKPKITISNDTEWRWVSELGDHLAPVATLTPGAVYPQLIEPNGEYFVNNAGQLSQQQGYMVVRLLEKETGADHKVETSEERRASHILISFAGADSAKPEVTRTESEAQTLAEEVLAKAKAGENFGELAKTYSADSSSTSGGDLGLFGRGKMVPAFEDAAFGLSEPGLVDRVIRTQFGYHIIQVTEIKAATSETKKEDRVKLSKAFFSTAPDGWQATGLTGKHFRRADVSSDPTTMRPIVNIYFSATSVADQAGGSIWQSIWYLVATLAAILAFVYGIGIMMAEGHKTNLRNDIAWVVVSILVFIGAIYGVQVTKPDQPAPDLSESTEQDEIKSPAEPSATDKAGVELFAELTKRNLNKPIAIFLDGEPIIDGNPGLPGRQDYAPTVQSEITNGQAVITGLSNYDEARELVQNLNTGAIPAPIKLTGQYTIGATLGESALRTSLLAGLYGYLAVVVFMIVLYRLPGIIASIALAIYCAILLAALQFFGVVLTLAGVAGVIFSLGMAVDANILIFERLKEELALGKTLSRALEDGFDRAWTSIRDGNVSTLITCAILLWFGSSIIKGFALTLSIGVLISMFTAITVSRIFLLALTTTFFREGGFWFGGRRGGN